jgi:uncharacterized protein
MINKTAVSAIDFYQIFISTLLKNVLGVSSMCRFEETCSAYTKREIREKGVIKGVGLGIRRILRCQPLTS